MADKATVSTLDTNQIATTDVAGPPTTPNLPGEQGTSASSPPDSLYPPQGPDPKGMNPEIGQEMAREAQSKGSNAPGVEAEQVIWEARYSMKNFIGRVVFRVLLTLGWIGLAIYTWGMDHPNASFLTNLLGIVLGILWILLLHRVFMARYSHYYRLTNRRLFVSTGLMRRRRDQMELIRIKDVFTRQNLLDRWLSLGTVVVVPTEPNKSPTFYLAGVDDPKRVMDLVWHCARAEREGKTVQIESP
jgi:membrane protein YdbS with pleckstrin-like domain